MKKEFASFCMAALLLAAGFAGCNGSSSSSPTPAASQPTSDVSGASPQDASAPPASDPIVISIGYDNNPGDPVDQACQYWAQQLDELSGGTMRMELYPSTQLGKTADIIDQAFSGDATVAFTNVAHFSDLGVKGWDVVAAPYLVNSWEDYDKVRASDWWADKEKQLEEEVGLKIISPGWRYGVRHLLSKKPVESLKDLKGMKVRVPADTSAVKTWESFGAVPSPMSLNEVYVALQQGTIDAVENPLSVLYSGSFQEVAKSLTLTAHKYDQNQWSCGMKFFSSLTPEQQDILLESGKRAAEYFNSIAGEAEDAKAMEDLKAAGVTVYELGDEARAQIFEQSQAYFDAPDSIWPKEDRQKIIDILKP